jgi:succinate dehydrogenase flavin-adding protein (antitoxin of CptAB toxin-antitoxin module)
MSEPITVRRKRLVHWSRYRGCLECDLLCGAFADQYLMTLDQGQLDHYEALLGESDQDLLDWVFERRPVPARHDHDVFHLLRNYRVAQRA